MPDTQKSRICKDSGVFGKDKFLVTAKGIRVVPFLYFLPLSIFVHLC